MAALLCWGCGIAGFFVMQAGHRVIGGIIIFAPYIIAGGISALAQ